MFLPGGNAAPVTDAGPNADDDQDGLTNFQETIRFTDGTVSDIDGDGLGGDFEVSVAGMNPILSDSFGHGSSDAETYQRRVARQGNDPGQGGPRALPALPAEGDACRIEGASGGGVPQDKEEGPLHRHCFLEDHIDPNRTGYCGNV